MASILGKPVESDDQHLSTYLVYDKTSKPVSQSSNGLVLAMNRTDTQDFGFHFLIFAKIVIIER